ncbi:MULTISPECIES: PrgI family protein [unclassified Paenibacillus]|uniref:PrgI family protein n=1 Tax=unclassified Paenibacillus TaxID=185978 RepID=UPI0006D1D085|nr:MULTISPECIES: PrgI family protein [unclassified Paenibacillus]
MEVKINREIREYTESIFFGLSLRQFFFSVLAVGMAIALYFMLRSRFGIETLSWVCVLGAAPFAALGFIRYHGMNAEQLLWAYIKSEFLMPRRLVFHSTNTYAAALSKTIEQYEKGMKRHD